MGEKLVGTPLIRREDPALITGQARYTDDMSVPGMAHAVVLRSQYGHATINSIDTSAAEELENVIAVFTGQDLAESDAPGVIHQHTVPPDAIETDFPVIATEKVRYIGDAVAVVVAEDRYTADSAVDLISVDYERHDAVTDSIDAANEDAPVLHDHAPDNIAFDWAVGDEAAVNDAFEKASHTVSLECTNQRLIGNPMETRAALAEYDPEDGLTLTMTTQSPYQVPDHLHQTLGIDEDNIRVISPAVGGGFGIKGQDYPDEIIASWCAMQVGRPVKWTATRSEGHSTDFQSRDFYLSGEMALDSDGVILGLRGEFNHTVGAYFAFGPSIVGNFKSLIAGQYEIPAIYYRTLATFTNTAPIGPYRGAGRPEIIYYLERLMDKAAAELGVDPAELRRQNQISPDAFPYETVLGTIYDSGDYERAMDLALEHVEYDDVRSRQADLREDGRYLGIGISCFVENTGSSPGRGENGRVAIDKDGHVTAYLGTHDHGQGHTTTFSQLLADELGMNHEEIDIEEGDTQYLSSGTGTYGSRSAALGGAAVIEAAQSVKERARELAADNFEAAVEDVEFADGDFFVSGAPDRSISFQELASIAADNNADLDATSYYDPPNYGFAFGTHIAVVEVNPENGEIALLKYVAVDDCGNVINPLIVEGQIHGGVAQGIAQALLEEAIYDETGTLLTGSFQDYAVPKSMHLPEMITDHTVTPSPHNPLGVKGTGESGTIASPPAVANAVMDAIRPFGIDEINMPFTPEKVWRAIRDAS